MATFSIKNCTTEELLEDRARVMLATQMISPKAVADGPYRGHLEALKYRETKITNELNRRSGKTVPDKDRRVVIDAKEYKASHNQTYGHGRRYGFARTPTNWTVYYKKFDRRIFCDARSCTRSEIEKDAGEGNIGQCYINVNSTQVLVELI